MNIVIIPAVVIIGFAAGLRAMTPLAVVGWAAHFGCIDLGATPFSFMSSPTAVGILSFLALGEYVGDLLPFTPSRTAPPGLVARILTGTFAGACLVAAADGNLLISLIGGVVAIGAAFAGFQMRTRLVKALRMHDAFVAIPEDLVALGLAVIAICISSNR